MLQSYFHKKSKIKIEQIEQNSLLLLLHHAEVVPVICHMQTPSLLQCYETTDLETY